VPRAVLSLANEYFTSIGKVVSEFPEDYD